MNRNERYITDTKDIKEKMHFMQKVCSLKSAWYNDGTKKYDPNQLI